ncbi:MAG TPA: hypothetical protein VLH08_08835 [Acidobacteriota bacterium]|nr:hypothetical protein [Acidobacteriota bacterium]
MLKRFAALILDVVLLAGTLAILFILVTGGGVFHIGSIRISAYSYSNGLYALIILGFLRSLLGNIPFLLIPGLEPSVFIDKLPRVASDITQWLKTINQEAALRSVWIIIGISLLIKLLNAWFYYF